MNSRVGGDLYNIEKLVSVLNYLDQHTGKGHKVVTNLEGDGEREKQSTRYAQFT